MSKVAPCKDCIKRYVGCHSSCKEYTEWLKEKRAINDERYKASIRGASASARTKVTAKVLRAKKGANNGTNKHCNND